MISPLLELCDYLKGWATTATSKHRFAELLGVEVAQDITTDLVKHERSIAASAYSAEQSDREALKLLEDAAKDGLQSSDMPAIAEAIRHIRRSAEKDRSISDAAAV